MKTEEIVFWVMIAIPAIVFVIIFVKLLKNFNKLLKKAEKYGKEMKKKKTCDNNHRG